MSNVSCPIGITGCLKATEEFLENDLEWNHSNETQKKYLLEYFSDTKEDLSKVEDVFEYIASKKSQVINSFLKERGFDIEVDEFGSDEFGAASVLDQMVEWMEEGDRKTIESNGNSYDGFSLDKGGSVVDPGDGENPIVRINTKEKNEAVYLTVPDEPLSYFDLFDYAVEKINEENDCFKSQKHEGVVVPMVDLDKKVDISWLCGLSTKDSDGDQWAVSQAEQQAKFRMNEREARA